MKLKFISLFLFLSIGIWITPLKTRAQNITVSFQLFYDELSPYGTWVNNPEYGYVWFPRVAAGFTPYASNGYWILTEDGWTWVSDYSWGWAPFHYGRWYIDPMYGAMWIPDNEWGPGWVSWRRSAGYYGWAPLGPRGRDMMDDNYYAPDDHWRFVRDRDFGKRNINNYYVNTSNNVTIIKNSTVIINKREDKVRNVSYNAGPDRNEVERNAGRKFTPVAIKESNKPAQKLQKDQLQLYRPRMEKGNTDEARKPIPAKVRTLQDIKPAAQKKEAAAQRPTQPNKQGADIQKQKQAQKADAPARNNNQGPGKQNDPVKKADVQRPSPATRPAMSNKNERTAGREPAKMGTEKRDQGNPDPKKKDKKPH